MAFRRALLGRIDSGFSPFRAARAVEVFAMEAALLAAKRSRILPIRVRRQCYAVGSLCEGNKSYILTACRPGGVIVPENDFRRRWRRRSGEGACRRQGRHTDASRRPQFAPGLSTGAAGRCSVRSHRSGIAVFGSVRRARAGSARSRRVASVSRRRTPSAGVDRATGCEADGTAGERRLVPRPLRAARARARAAQPGRRAGPSNHSSSSQT